MILEIRTYKLRSGRVEDFVAASEASQPLLREFGIDVVAYGTSAVSDEGDHAYLIRSFPSIEERERLEEAFYGSDAWRQGPRQAVLDPIESYHTVVLEVEAATVEALRR